MDLEQIKELLKLVAESGVSEVEIEDEDFRMVVRTGAAPAAAAGQPTAVVHQLSPAKAESPEGPSTGEGDVPPATTDPSAANGRVLRAPIVGTYYAAPSPDAEPFVQVGDVVKPGDVLCIIEAMKLMNEIEAEVGGTIREILVENAQPVQYDEPLFVVEP